jgi:hypothetical protein
MSKRHSWLRIIGVHRWDASVEPLIPDLTTLCFHVQQHAGHVRLILHILQTDTKQPLNCKASSSEAAVFSTIDTLHPASLCCGAPLDKSCTGEDAICIPAILRQGILPGRLFKLCARFPTLVKGRGRRQHGHPFLHHVPPGCLNRHLSLVFK